MAQPTYSYKVTTPFAINGSKDEIPTTTEDGSVSLENGYGTLYETPPSEGGRFIRRGEWNYLINFLYNAIKELQDIITAGEFTVSASQTLTNILPLALGGTGASTEEQARSNLGLGNVNNTSDLNKPISTATQNALNNKLNIAGGTINGNLTVTGEITEQGHRLAPMPIAVKIEPDGTSVSPDLTVVGAMVRYEILPGATWNLEDGGSWLSIRLVTNAERTYLIGTYVNLYDGGYSATIPSSQYVSGWLWRLY